jgi:hypothetical protein
LLALIADRDRALGPGVCGHFDIPRRLFGPALLRGSKLHERHHDEEKNAVKQDQENYASVSDWHIYYLFR